MTTASAVQSENMSESDGTNGNYGVGHTEQKLCPPRKQINERMTIIASTIRTQKQLAQVIITRTAILRKTCVGSK